MSALAMSWLQRLRAKRIRHNLSPLTQLTMALVALAGLLVVLADLFFNVMPTRTDQALRLRKQQGEAVAVQVTTLLRRGDMQTLQSTLDDVAARTAGLQSIAVRRASGELVASSGDHRRHWQHDSNSAASTADAVFVPLAANGRPWGSFEMAFAPPRMGLLGQYLSEPLVLTMLFISAAGTLVFRLYVRRALQHLDPSSVIPDRVQAAFDTMSEAVLVLDAQGRLLLGNAAMRRLRGEADVAVGATLSTQAWALEAFGQNPAAHPWTRVMEQKAPLAGVTARLRTAGGKLHEVVLNGSPVTDNGGRVRGCILTFNDVTELHEVNAALRATLSELAASKDEIQRKNDELHRLATRDPMTGCMNRRSFMELYRRLFTRAKGGETALGFIVLDIDHFKSVNDTHGHSVGDRVIQEVARCVTEASRSADLVCRYGGEEFVVAAGGLSPAAMMNFGERLRAKIEAEAGPAVKEVPGMRVTISVGVAMLTHESSSEQQLIDQADEALYEAKRGGRNQVRLWRLPAVSSAMPLGDV